MVAPMKYPEELRERAILLALDARIRPAIKPSIAMSPETPSLALTGGHDKT